jgi:hypothetical protein
MLLCFTIGLKFLTDSSNWGYGTRVMPPIPFRKCNCNNNEIYVDGTYILCKFETILPIILRHSQHTFANADLDAVYK